MKWFKKVTGAFNQAPKQKPSKEWPRLGPKLCCPCGSEEFYLFENIDERSGWHDGFFVSCKKCEQKSSAK